MCAAVRRTASAKPVAMPMVAVVSAWGHVSLLTLSAIPRPSSATAPLQLASALSAARITVAAACARAPALVLRMFALLGCASASRTASAKPVAMPMVAVVSAWGHVSLLTLSAIPRPSSATAPLQLASALSAARITVAAACARAPALVLRMFALLGCASASRTASAKPVARMGAVVPAGPALSARCA